jgi:hypothetical protein
MLVGLKILTKWTNGRNDSEWHSIASSLHVLGKLNNFPHHVRSAVARRLNNLKVAVYRLAHPPKSYPAPE